jgi:threonine/homoserine/homoserine lactone efflux protein
MALVVLSVGVLMEFGSAAQRASDWLSACVLAWIFIAPLVAQGGARSEARCEERAWSTHRQWRGMYRVHGFSASWPRGLCCRPGPDVASLT